MNQDFFANIAMTKHPLPNEDEEIRPRELPGRYFEKIEEACSESLPERPGSLNRTQRLKAFYEDLEKLKEKYRPFLSNHLPDNSGVASLPLKDFHFRYIKDGEVFTDLKNFMEAWETVTIPDYRGPAGVDGKWRAYYKAGFDLEETEPGKRVLLRFQCVDYKAFVYVNGNYAGSHEGLFSPFEFDITGYAAVGINELVVEVHNDIPILGEGPVLDGDKIYGATGPGWDDPQTGWHHCPAGAGIFGGVTVEIRPSVYISTIFPRPDIDFNFVELRIGVINYENRVCENFQLEIALLPKNFEGKEALRLIENIRYVGIGQNEYRYRVPIKDYRLWEPDSPFLYGACVTLIKEGARISEAVQSFGMRKFASDEASRPKGRLFFNNRPIILRGANEMGHLQQCVMKGDLDQLIEDILIAKLCHLNYYRITQRPVQEEIYDYFDMLGMMHQCDFPLFGFLRRNQTWEALKQVGEMERLIRSHPSSVMVSFINEPFSIRPTADPNSKFTRRYEAKGHRHLFRDELEAFFAAARKVIYIENPDRVIKNVEGDYDPPTGEGMPDFHCYTMWYTNHAIPAGKLHKGYLPPIKKGWMAGCGEYGAEGLDNYTVMTGFYPKEWLKADENGHWYPDKIVKAQTHSLQGDWYPEQNTVEAWIRESQRHQANATALMTDAYRRRADILNHTAIHLLIDAWPAGWMKALVGVDRVPKDAYFAYSDALVPFRVHLRSDRRYVYGAQEVPVEAWLLNDLPEAKAVTVTAYLRQVLTEEEAPSSLISGKAAFSGSYADCEGSFSDSEGSFSGREDSYSSSEGSPARLGSPLASFRLDGSVNAADAVCMGIIPLRIPELEAHCRLRLEAVMEDKSDGVFRSEHIEFMVYPSTASRGGRKVAGLSEGEKRVNVASEGGKSVNVASEGGSEATGASRGRRKVLAASEGGSKVTAFYVGDYAKSLLETCAFTITEDLPSARAVVVSDLSGIAPESLAALAKSGKNIVLLMPEEEPVKISLGDITFETVPCQEVYFAACEPSIQKYGLSMLYYDLSMLYNEKADCIDFIGNKAIRCSEAGQSLVYTYERNGLSGQTGAKKKLPFVLKYKTGKGTITAVSLLLKGRTGCNPNLDQFLTNCIEGSV